jgi:hypothetical protein
MRCPKQVHSYTCKKFRGLQSIIDYNVENTNPKIFASFFTEAKTQVAMALPLVS